jgi:hypothetical protein
LTPEAQNEPASPQEPVFAAVPEESMDKLAAVREEEPIEETAEEDEKISHEAEEEVLAIEVEPALEETADPTADNEGGWRLVGKDYLGALQARSVLLAFTERVIEQVNEGVPADDPGYYTTDRFWAEDRTQEWEVRLCNALEELGTSREDWEKVQEERRNLNALAHTTVSGEKMLAAIQRHISGNKLPSDAQNARRVLTSSAG